MSEVLNIGDKFGKLTIIDSVSILGKKSKKYWRCRCECGGYTEASTSLLRSGRLKSCGHCRENTILGKHFDKLQVLEVMGYDKFRNLIVKCKCDCGNEIVVQAHRLYSGERTSCGKCIRFEMIGKRFGSLVVTKFAYVKNNKSWYEAKCDCGNTCLVSGNHLRSGKTINYTCGKCYSGLKDTFKPNLKERCIKLSKVWNAMRNRCRNPKTDSFMLYGGSGIELKIDKFEFIKMFYNNPDFQTNLQIDRCDTNKGYEVGNIRWVTLEENAKNKFNTYETDYDAISKKIMTMTTFSKLCAVNKMEPFEFIMNKVSSSTSPIPKDRELWLFVHKSLDVKHCIDRIEYNFTKYNGSIKFEPKLEWGISEELI